LAKANNQTTSPLAGLHLICASCNGKLGKFTETPKTSNWKDCKVESIAPVLQLIPGSSQVCPLCGEYFLIKNGTRPCKECGHPISVPAGGVMTDQGPLEQLVSPPLHIRPTRMILNPEVAKELSLNDDQSE
jgi:hypothetical protein